MAKYKPGQLFTCNGKIYRVMKTDKKDYCNEACIKNNEYNNILCVHDFLGIPTLMTTLQCQKCTGTNYPKYIKNNPLCVNKLKTGS